MGRHQNAFSGKHEGLNMYHVIGQRAGQRIFQGLAARWRHIIGPAPDQHLLFAPFLAGIVLIQSCEFAIVALVQCLVAGFWQTRLA